MTGILYPFRYPFQSPIYGSRTKLVTGPSTLKSWFQSPIYGSRTYYLPLGTLVPATFQSPIYGSRTRSIYWFTSRTPRVSIPYLRVTHKIGYGSFHTQILVSIPYLRVTHSMTGILLPLRYPFQSPIYGSRTVSFSCLVACDCMVSIPYLRVTHGTEKTGRIPRTVFQSPIYGSRTTSGQITGHSKEEFQSPIYGSRTVYEFPILSV